MLDQRNPDGKMGLGAHFPSIGRYAVRSIEPTPALLRLLLNSKPKHPRKDELESDITGLRSEFNRSMIGALSAL